MARMNKQANLLQSPSKKVQDTKRQKKDKSKYRDKANPSLKLEKKTKQEGKNPRGGKMVKDTPVSTIRIPSQIPI